MPEKKMMTLEERAMQRILSLPKLDCLEDDWKYCLKCRQGEKMVVSCECVTCGAFNIGSVMNKIQDEDYEELLCQEQEREWQEYIRRQNQDPLAVDYV